MALAQVIIIPEIITGAASGRVIVKNTLSLEPDRIFALFTTS